MFFFSPSLSLSYFPLFWCVLFHSSFQFVSSNKSAESTINVHTIYTFRSNVYIHTHCVVWLSQQKEQACAHRTFIAFHRLLTFYYVLLFEMANEPIIYTVHVEALMIDNKFVVPSYSLIHSLSSFVFFSLLFLYPFSVFHSFFFLLVRFRSLSLRKYVCIIVMPISAFLLIFRLCARSARAVSANGRDSAVPSNIRIYIHMCVCVYVHAVGVFLSFYVCLLDYVHIFQRIW